MKSKILFVFISASMLVSAAFTQTKSSLPLTADSLATGNYKDVLNSFFQLAFNKITGPEKTITFTSNPYAVLARLDTGLLMDREYYKYRHLRSLNFSFSTNLDSSYKFNGFSSGLKYALINKRDETVSRAFLDMAANDKKVVELGSLNFELEAYITTLESTPAQHDTTRNQKTRFFRGEINFDKLDKAFQNKIKEIAKDKNAQYLLALIAENPGFNMKKTSQEVYDNLKNYYNNRLLWTIGISDTTYKNQFMFSNLVVTSELVKGLDSMKSADIELNLKSSLQYADDTLKAGRDLKRSILSFEPGINFVLKNIETLKSFFEFKLSGSYYHNFGALYAGEKRDRLTLNGTFRIRILNDIWIPLEIKYEPRTGNIFGFLNVRANFTKLGKGG